MQVESNLVQEEPSKKSSSSKSPFKALMKILQKEGVAGLYAGIGSGLIGTIVSSYSFFYIYSYLRSYYLNLLAKSKPGSSISTTMELALGAASGIYIILANKYTSRCHLPILCLAYWNSYN